MKLNSLIIVVLLLAWVFALPAEQWKLDSDVMVNLTQSQFSDNWAGTELSNITWTATSNTTAQKQLKNWLKNKNTLLMAFGQTHLQEKDALNNVIWKAPQKSTDKINFESLFQFTLQSYVDPYASLRMDSQFLDEVAGGETMFVNPIQFTQSAGIMRTIFDKEKIKMNVRLGGAVREKYNRRMDDVPVDGGLEFIADYKQVLDLINANYTSKLTAYQALFKSDADDADDNWKALDVKWENMLSFKLFKALSLNLNLDFIYEKEQVDQIQWREVLGLGLSYTLF